MSEESKLTVPDGWKEPESKDEDYKSRLLEESSFSFIFPKYREKYIKGAWAEADAFLQTKKIKGELDLIKGSITVKTTIKTRDPFAIMNARDYIQSICRGVPVDAAQRIFKDDCFCDVIKIGGFHLQNERFKKRRQRLIGNEEGSTLKALEILTQCYILIQGHTVTALGSHRGLKDVRRIVIATMKNNVHPVYLINQLMIKKELAKNPALKNESWDKYIPKFARTPTSSKRKSKPKVAKKEYTPFPPPQPMSKMDKQIESGEYFLKEPERKQKKRMEQKAKQAESAKKNAEKRLKSLQPPKEKKRKIKDESTTNEQDVSKLVESIKKSSKTKKVSANVKS